MTVPSIETDTGGRNADALGATSRENGFRRVSSGRATVDRTDLLGVLFSGVNARTGRRSENRPSNAAVAVAKVLANVSAAGIRLEAGSTTMSSQRPLDRPVTCRACGTENDGCYTYCRRCLGTLPARPDARR